MSGEAVVPVPDSGSKDDGVIDKIWLEDDDEETLAVLLAKKWEDDSLPTRLESLAQRFRHDADVAREDSFWQTLISSATEFGFESIHSMAALEGTTTATPSTSGQDAGQGDTSGCPCAFETKSGKMHARAVASFLGVSERRAIQLTMSALRNIHNNNNNNYIGSDKIDRSLLSLLSSLLGTLTLLRQVVDFYYSRRLARLCVISECLRIEQDAEGSKRSSPSPVFDLLNNLDSSTRWGDGRQRGLFRRLLAVACQPHIPPTVSALAPALELKSDLDLSHPRTTEVSSSTSDGRHRRWNQFVSDCVEASRMQKDLERGEAMEGLLVLLYQHIQGGVRRDDYICLLLAFSTLEFFTKLRGGQRLSYQAGLLCAECMALWRIFSFDEDDEFSSDWVFRHPLLERLFDPSTQASETAASELDALQKLLQRLGQHAMERVNSNSTAMKAPESLALLSFGLLLSQSFRSLLESDEGSDTQAYWQTFRITGFEMAKVAGNEYGALDFLQAALDSVVETDESPVPLPARLSKVAYDWQLHASLVPEIEEVLSKRSSPMSVTYSSLGLEVLKALIATFQDTVLSLDHPGAAANIAMLCDLAAVVYRNEPMLCGPFLADWIVYSARDKNSPPELPQPMCYLMEAASQLTTAAVNFSLQGQVAIDYDFFLPSITPLLRLVSSLCYSSEVVESVVATLPEGVFRKAFIHARKTYEVTENFSTNRIRVLDSISTLLRIGNSRSCRKMFMNALEVKGSIALDAPRLILKTFSGPDDKEAIRYVLSITADLLQSGLDEPRWAVNVASLLLAREATVSLVRVLSGGEPQLLLPASKVLLALSESLSSVFVNTSVSDTEKSQYMEQVLDGTLASLGVLTSSMSSLSSSPVPFAVVEIILLGISSFLTHLQPILHLQSNICEIGARARDVLMNAFVVKGEPIAYFAVLPISFHLSDLMEDAYRRENVFGHLKSEESSRPIDHLTHLAHRPPQPFSLQIARMFSELSVIKFDIEAWKSRNWILPSDQSAIFGSASAAVRVLLLWASHAERSVSGRQGTRMQSDELDDEARSELLSLSPQDLLSSLMVAPPSIRKNAVLSELWSSIGFANIELLMLFLKVGNESEGSQLIPNVAILDLLAMTVFHLKISVPTVEDSTLFRILRLSPFIRPTLWEFVTETRDILRNNDFEPSPACHNRLTRCLRTLRVLGVAIDKDLLMTTALLVDQSQKADIIHQLFDCVGEMIKITERIPMGRLCQDETTLVKMRLATGCLDILLSIRKFARAMNPDSVRIGLFASVVEDSSVFVSLWLVVVKFVSSADAQRWQLGAPEAYKLTMLAFFASVFDIFTTEMAWTLQNKGKSSDLLVDFYRNGADLVAIISHFTKFSGFEAFLSATKQMFAEVGLRPSHIPVATLLSFQTTPSPSLEQDFLVPDNIFDVLTATSWFLSVLPMDTDSSILTVLVANIASAKNIFSNECHFLGVLARFSEMYIMSQDHDVVGVARASLHWLRVNAELVEASLAQLGDTSFRNETIGTVCALADLVVSVSGINLEHLGKTGTDALMALLVDLGDASGTLFPIFGVTSQTETDVLRKICAAQQGLLASAIAIGQRIEALHPSSFQKKEVIKLDTAYLELTGVACKVLSLLECLRSDGGKLSNSDRNVFLTCVALIRMVLSGRTASRESKTSSDSILLQLGQVLREYNVLNVLGSEAHRASQLCGANCETSNSSLLSTYPGEPSDLRVVASVVDFLRVMVESRHPRLLALFSQDRIAEIITRNPLIAFALGVVWNSNDLHQRGYLPCRELKDGVARDDPVHKLWITVLCTVKSLLRISSAHDPSSEYFAEIAADFINANRSSIISCLTASSARPLTLNILKEASSILSLLSEACTDGNPNGIHPDLQIELSTVLTGVVACLSNFLGASGAAHELFDVLERLDSSDGAWDNQSSVHSSAPPTHPLLTTGVPNARHEGIRYAHFAFQCSGVMTQQDYNDSSALKLGEHNQGLEPQSPSTIERKGRNTMSSNFQGRMEKGAAECLFHALLVVWRLHPAASSFVSLSPGAGSRPDTWSLVKPGMLIAYQQSSDIGLRTGPAKIVHVARVLHVDTIHRSWRVRVVRPGLEEFIKTDATVQIHQLVGIENRDKRRCLFQFTPAPDTASELEQLSTITANHRVTLGHLILALRWCHQHKMPALTKSLVAKLGEVCVAILGSEVSLYREIGVGDGGVTIASKRIEEQLLDLIGDTDVSTGLTHPRESKLKQVLSPLVLLAVKSQVGPELRQAQNEQEITRRKQTEMNVAAVDGGVGFGGVRRSSSAFRGLRVPLD